jgi:hypothetical protein
MTNSDGTIKTFATFRIVGDNLDPEEITRILRVYPTLAYAKGERYKAGDQAGKIKGKMGVWYLSTDKAIRSQKLSEHIMPLFAVLALDHFEEWLKEKSQAKYASSSVVAKRAAVPEFMLRGRLRHLSALLKRRSLTASLSCFWHGEVGAKPPAIPRLVSSLFKLVPISIETDFDTDEAEPTPRRLRA